jgi:hypothetical protein
MAAFTGGKGCSNSYTQTRADCELERRERVNVFDFQPDDELPGVWTTLVGA